VTKRKGESKVLHLAGYLGQAACGNPSTNITENLMAVTCRTCIKSTAYWLSSFTYIPPDHPAYTPNWWKPRGPARRGPAR
jgi:hypothetical protein